MNCMVANFDSFTPSLKQYERFIAAEIFTIERKGGGGGGGGGYCWCPSSFTKLVIYSIFCRSQNVMLYLKVK